MTSIVTGTLLKPDGLGVGIKSFIITKANSVTRKPMGQPTTFSTDSGGTFSVTLQKGFYLMIFGNDQLYFRVKDNGVTYNLGDILEPLK